MLATLLVLAATAPAVTLSSLSEDNGSCTWTRRDLATGRETRVVRVKGSCGPVAWSPNGARALLYSGVLRAHSAYPEEGEGRGDLWMVDLAKRTARKLSLPVGLLADFGFDAAGAAHALSQCGTSDVDFTRAAAALKGLDERGSGTTTKMVVDHVLEDGDRWRLVEARPGIFQARETRSMTMRLTVAPVLAKRTQRLFLNAHAEGTPVTDEALAERLMAAAVKPGAGFGLPNSRWWRVAADGGAYVWCEEDRDRSCWATSNLVFDVAGTLTGVDARFGPEHMMTMIQSRGPYLVFSHGSGPLRVYDTRSGKVVFSAEDAHEPSFWPDREEFLRATTPRPVTPPTPQQLAGFEVTESDYRKFRQLAFVEMVTKARLEKKVVPSEDVNREWKEALAREGWSEERQEAVLTALTEAWLMLLSEDEDVPRDRLAEAQARTHPTTLVTVRAHQRDLDFDPRDGEAGHWASQEKRTGLRGVPTDAALAGTWELDPDATRQLMAERDCGDRGVLQKANEFSLRMTFGPGPRFWSVMGADGRKLENLGDYTLDGDTLEVRGATGEHVLQQRLELAGRNLHLGSHCQAMVLRPSP